MLYTIVEGTVNILLKYTDYISIITREGLNGTNEYMFSEKNSHENLPLKFELANESWLMIQT